MIGNNRKFLRIIVAICVLGLFVATTASSSGGNSKRGVNFTGLQAFDICLQDDSSQDTLQINSTTGAYKYTRCSDGRMLTATGKVTTQGCTITLQDFVGIRRVTAKVDTCGRRASASVQVRATVNILNVTITDRNTANNTCDCTAPPPPSPEPPPLPRENISIGEVSIFQDNENIVVSVPLTISRLSGAAVVDAEFSLFLVGGQGEPTSLASGTISSNPASNSTACGVQDEDCFGTCGDRLISVTHQELACFTDCTFEARFGRRTVEAQCRPIAPQFGGGCQCVDTIVFVFGPFPRATIEIGTSLLFVVDPDGLLPEFGETDNQVITPVPPPCIPTPL